MQRSLAIIVFFQLLVSLYLGIVIIRNKSQVLGKTSINILPKENYSENIKSTLQSFYEPNPDIVYEETMNEHTATYSINSDTLHEPGNYQIERHSNVFRIMALGDSFTFGILVDTKDNWTEKLEMMLNQQYTCEGITKFEVINLGVGGYDMEYALERFKVRGAKYNPDVIIWLIKGDDLWQVNRIIRPLAQEYSHQNSKSAETEEYSPLVRAVQEFKDNTDIDQITDIQQKHLSDLKTIYQGKTVFAFMENTSIDKDDQIMSSMLKKAAADFQTGFYFQFPDVYQNKKWVIQGNGHPTSDGHTVMAESIFNYLTTRNILCN